MAGSGTAPSSMLLFAGTKVPEPVPAISVGATKPGIEESRSHMRHQERTKGKHPHAKHRG